MCLAKDLNRFLVVGAFSVIVKCSWTLVPALVQMQSSTNVDILRLELIQRGVSVSHPLIQGKIKIHPELQADLSMMFYYVLKPLQQGYKCFL